VEKLIIGVWQGACRDGDLGANLARAEAVIDEAARAGCEFVCLPEMYLTGSGTRENVERCAMALDDERLLALARFAQKRDVTALVGMSERQPRSVANTQVILDGGRALGHYSKTMLTRGDSETMLVLDDELPVFEARGVRFGVIICHDSSFPEIAATMAWKGARIIFSPHFNSIAPERMDEHRTVVRNNHVGMAAHYDVVVARSNVVGVDPDGERLRYGDSAIFSPLGSPLAEAGLFAERLVTADVAPWLERPRRWRDRSELRPAIIEELSAAALSALAGPERRRRKRRT
jgi:predicted amidohydrolase